MQYGGSVKVCESGSGLLQGISILSWGGEGDFFFGHGGVGLREADMARSLEE